jgi:hypothetical protein
LKPITPLKLGLLIAIAHTNAKITNNPIPVIGRDFHKGLSFLMEVGEGWDTSGAADWGREQLLSDLIIASNR